MMTEKGKKILLNVLQKLPADRIVWDKSNFKDVMYQGPSSVDKVPEYYKDFKIRIVVETTNEKNMQEK